MSRNIIDVVLQPMGRTPGVLEPPLAKYKPQIVVLITSHHEYADITIQHIEHTWRRHVGRLPHVIVKIVKRVLSDIVKFRFSEVPRRNL